MVDFTSSVVTVVSVTNRFFTGGAKIIAAAGTLGRGSCRVKITRSAVFAVTVACEYLARVGGWVSRRVTGVADAVARGLSAFANGSALEQKMLKLKCFSVKRRFFSGFNRCFFSPRASCRISRTV